jgi:hypothetical protein
MSNAEQQAQQLKWVHQAIIVATSELQLYLESLTMQLEDEHEHLNDLQSQIYNVVGLSVRHHML